MLSPYWADFMPGKPQAILSRSENLVMAEDPVTLARRLSQEGIKVTAFFKLLAPQQWNVEIYTEGSRWTVLQILAHFDITETSIGGLIENILEGGDGAPQGFDLDEFNEHTVSDLQVLSASELLARFTAHRQGTIEMVGRLSDDDLQKTGRHPFLGITSLADIIKLMYRHNQIHLRDIRRALAR